MADRPPEFDEKEIARDPSQHAVKCPGCLGTNTRLVPGQNPGDVFMGCDSCGHTWVGKDFAQDEAEEARPPIPDTEA